MASVGSFMALAGLHEKWDGVARLRKRLRDIKQITAEQPEGKELEQPGPVPKTNANLRYNQDVLIPLVEAMHGVYDKVPSVEALEEQLGELFKSNGIGVNATILNEQAWAVRYLFGVLKQHLYKSAPSKDRFRVISVQSMYGRHVCIQDPKIRYLLEQWGLDLENWRAGSEARLTRFNCSSGLRPRNQPSQARALRLQVHHHLRRPAQPTSMT